MSAFSFISDKSATYLLAFIGGFVDAAGYLKLQGVFTSSITGNLVVACASVSSMNGVICRSCVCLAFTLAACTGASLGLTIRLKKSLSFSMTSALLFFLEFLFLIIAWVVGLILDESIASSKNLDDWAVVLIGSVLGASMGFHNIAAKEAITNCPATTVMTSTLVTVGQHTAHSLVYSLASLADRSPLPATSPAPAAAGVKGGKAEEGCKGKAGVAAGKLQASSEPLVAFLAGAVIGAVVMHHASFWSLAVPSGGVLLLILDLIYTALRPASPDPAAPPPPTAATSSSCTAASVLFVDPAAGTGRAEPAVLPGAVSPPPPPILSGAAAPPSTPGVV